MAAQEDPFPSNGLVKLITNLYIVKNVIIFYHKKIGIHVFYLNIVKILQMGDEIQFSTNGIPDHKWQLVSFFNLTFDCYFLC